MQECGQHPETFIMDTGVRVNDGKWHHVVVCFSFSGEAATAPTNTGGGTGATAPPAPGTSPPPQSGNSSASGAIFSQATGPAGTPPYPGTYGQYSGPKGEFEFGGLTNPGAPYEEVGKYGPADGGEIKSACRAWIAIDGKTLKGKALNHSGAWNTLLGKNGGQKLIDALHPHAILPPNAFLAPMAEVRSQMMTSGTQWERDYRTLLGGATGPAAIIGVTHEKRQQDYDRPVYDYTPTALPTFGMPISIPAGVGFGSPKDGSATDWNEETEMAELQIWANKTIDLDVPKNILLFITKDGEPEVNFKAVEKVLGKPEIRLHGSGNWKNGNNTGTLGYKITGSGRTRKKKKIPEGQFKFKGKIDRKLPDPEIKDYKPPGTT
jgi:hypothetical protein